MSNVRVWTVDDDGDLLRGGYYPRGASGTGMADDEADELRAILERGQAPAAPSEGDGRRPVFDFWIATDPSHVIIATADDGGYSVGLNSPERAAVFVDWANRHSADPAPPAPLPPGVHRAPNGALWLLPGAKMPEGYEFRLSRFHAWDTPIPSALAEPVWSDQARELRPLPVPPVPEPEKVPWAEAIWNKRLIARTFEGREPFVAMFVDDATGTEFAATLEKIITDGDGYEPIDADGLVSVLPLGDPK